MAESRKQEVITFKVDRALARTIRKIDNRSEFIRNVIQAALEEKCPLCNGTGYLNQAQANHLATFLKDHSINYCDDCHSSHLTCSPPLSKGDH